MKNSILSFIAGIILTICMSMTTYESKTIVYYSNEPADVKKFIDKNSKKGYFVTQLEMIQYYSGESKCVFVVMKINYGSYFKRIGEG